MAPFAAALLNRSAGNVTPRRWLVVVSALVVYWP